MEPREVEIERLHSLWRVATSKRAKLEAALKLTREQQIELETLNIEIPRLRRDFEMFVQKVADGGRKKD